MESQPQPAVSEEVHTLAPENLPKELKLIAIQATENKYTEVQKINVVMHAIEARKPTKDIAAQHGISVPLLRAWMNRYNVKAHRLIAQTQAASQAAKRVSEKEKRDAVEKISGPPKYQPPAPARKRRDFSAEQKKALVEKHIKSGVGVERGARDLGIHPTVLRRWIKNYKGGQVLGSRDLKSTKGIAPMAKAATATESTNARTLSERGKLLVAARYSEMQKDMSMESAALKLHVSESALRSWMIKWKALKPQGRAALLREVHGTQYRGGGAVGSKWQDPKKISAVNEWAGGTPLRQVAANFKVHHDTIKNWWHKIKGNVPIPQFGTLHPHIDLSQTERKKLIERWEAGEPSGELAKGAGIAPTTLRGWWEVFRPGQPRPQAGGNKRYKGRKVGAKNKKTLTRMEIAAAVTGGGQLVDVVGEHVNGAAQPISTGKASHDAIVFLRMARDAAQKGIVAGRVQLDDPMVLFPMLALHTLNT